MARLQERGGTEEEVRVTVETGERFEAKLGRTGFRCNFSFEADWLVITVIVKYF